MRKGPKIALAWFSRDEYASILAIYSSSETLPDDYETWRRRAEQEEARLIRHGFDVHREFIAADGLFEWVRGRFREIDSNAVSAYADHLYRHRLREPAG